MVVVVVYIVVVVEIVLVVDVVVVVVDIVVVADIALVENIVVEVDTGVEGKRCGRRDAPTRAALVSGVPGESRKGRRTE